MTFERRPFAIGFAIALTIGAAVASARPHVVERWALYLGRPQEMREAHLFLDPFPNAYSCRTRVDVFAASGEAAFCASRYELEVGTANDAVLATEFDPLSRAAWFCIPRRASRPHALT